MFYLNSNLFWNTTNTCIPVWSLLYVYRLLTGLTAQQKGTTAQWYSNKTSLLYFRIKEVCTRKEFNLPNDTIEINLGEKFIEGSIDCAFSIHLPVSQRIKLELISLIKLEQTTSEVSFKKICSPGIKNFNS